MLYFYNKLKKVYLQIVNNNIRLNLIIQIVWNSLFYLQKIRSLDKFFIILFINFYNFYDSYINIKYVKNR